MKTNQLTHAPTQAIWNDLSTNTKNTYDHEKAKQLWQYLIDDAAKEYVREFGTQGEDVKDMFPQETRVRVAEIIADREFENLKQGEYDVAKGTIS